MLNKITYRPDRSLKAGMLVAGVIVGLVVAFLTGKARFLLILPVLSQYELLIFMFQNVLYPDEIKSLERLVTSARLTDTADSHTLGWYRASAILTLKMHTNFYELKINANGISNTTNIDKLANQVGSAFHHSAYLTRISNGYATYRIDLRNRKQRIHDNDF